MKAIVFEEHGGVEKLQYKEIPDPKVGPNEVLFKIRAAGCNYNDIWARRGLPGMEIIMPHVSGSDASGEVVEVGSEVTSVKPGDDVMVHPGISCRSCEACTSGQEFFCRRYRIWGFQTGPLDGADAEYGKLPEANLIPKPANISYQEAATLPLILMTVWRMLVTRARIQAGDFVLIWGGAGGLGSMAIQVCNLFGARGIAVVGSDEKVEYAKNLGAYDTINRKTQKVRDEVRRITNKVGVDIVFEHTGEQTWKESVGALKRGGSLGNLRSDQRVHRADGHPVPVEQADELLWVSHGFQGRVPAGHEVRGDRRDQAPAQPGRAIEGRRHSPEDDRGRRRDG